MSLRLQLLLELLNARLELLNLLLEFVDQRLFVLELGCDEEEGGVLVAEKGEIGDVVKIRDHFSGEPETIGRVIRIVKLRGMHRHFF